MAPVPRMRVASPERWWRAATAPLIAGLIGWFAGAIRPRLHPGPSPGLPLTARIAVTCLAVAVGLCLAVLIMRTHLTRAYSRLPSAQHLDELTRICWTLEEAATKRPE
jgi:hypothetical protein